ncbi:MULTISPECIES: sigma factor-like helix-turn-helix DNA-binding protein [Paenibacillus]|uniref:RNA polymerase sigma-70 factor (ECF subfamily) n=1 Tax=Paenibacillus pabuli TaxID=1472 RepID=A0A855XR61_9BACL|nr:MULTISPECIES: sigma factor-like helix-turn-helix DNA-binding protein [Paenibacillus]PWW37376.1 RNA polymerase sigma-70 factor (ECF subfamily) [Paenibacillus pabuli]PXW05518.1 RNA polymerase sigma-70 factor (ECF subfamily) [Paenibacillus taichungensis]
MVMAQLSPELSVTDLGEATVLNYQKSRKIADKAYDRAKANENESDKKLIAQMVSDCDYAIEWLSTGRRPGNKRGVERLAAYQREKLVDPLKMQAYVQQGHAGSSANLSDWQLFQIEDALSRLSPRERECYVMKHGDCHSFADIAMALNISKSAVQSYVETAQRKISEDLQNSLFLGGYE